MSALRLWRAHVEDWAAEKAVVLVVFVEAETQPLAVARARQFVALIDGTSTTDIAVGNVLDAQALYARGHSTEHDRELRLFENGGTADEISWVQAPLFFVRDPGPLLRAWAQLAQHVY